MGRLGCQDDDEGDRTVVYLAGADPLGALAHRAAPPRQGDHRLHVAGDVRADEGYPTHPPVHSAMSDEHYAAAGEADHVDLLVLRPTSSTSAMPKAKCIAGRRERLAAAHGPMTTSTATRPSVAV